MRWRRSPRLPDCARPGSSRPTRHTALRRCGCPPLAAAWLGPRGRPALAVIAATAMAGTIGFLDDTTAKAALVASLPMIALLYWCPRPVARVAAGVCALFILTAPLTLAKLERIPGLFAAADSFKVSAGHRLLIWSFTGEHI